MNDHLITSDPRGRPVIAGTHVTVKEVLKELAAWGEVDRILTAHPELDRNAVQAALEFAAEKMHRTASAPLPPPALRKSNLFHGPSLEENCSNSEKKPFRNSARIMSRS